MLFTYYLAAVFNNFAMHLFAAKRNELDMFSDTNNIHQWKVLEHEAGARRKFKKHPFYIMDHTETADKAVM